MTSGTAGKGRIFVIFGEFAGNDPKGSPPRLGGVSVDASPQTGWSGQFDKTVSKNPLGTYPTTPALALSCSRHPA
jgi:hypothetical protein